MIAEDSGRALQIYQCYCTHNPSLVACLVPLLDTAKIKVIYFQLLSDELEGDWTQQSKVKTRPS